MAVVLIIDDEQNILLTLSRALRLEGFTTEVAPTGAQGLDLLSRKNIDLVLLDVMLPETDGLAVLSEIRARGHTALPVVMMSGHATIEVAVRAVQLGAADFLEKPLSSERVLVSVKNALKMRSLSEENCALKERCGLATRLVGSGPAIRELVSQIGLVAPSNARVLITGENGTGKEIVARAIHENSRRAGGPFVKLNCAAVPEELIESELFGHEKGAFTGAHQMRRGKFEVADGGTLFLDEIGDMPLGMQAKLLRVLQEGEFERVGSSDTRKVDARVVAATNQDLEVLQEQGRFRQDLFFRLNVVPIHVPPLRQRTEDIRELSEHFLRLACEENNQRPKRLSPEAESRLLSHAWPGNVRELKNSLERLVIMVRGDEIGAADVERHLALAPVRANERRQELFDPSLSLRQMLERAERTIVERAVQDSLGNITNAAKQLNIDRSHLYKKMRALGIKS